MYSRTHGAQRNKRYAISLKGYIPGGASVLMSAVVAAVAAFSFLAVVASQHAFTTTDLQIARWVRSLDLPGLDATLGAVNFLTDAPMAITLWILAGAFFVLRDRPLEAIAIFLISGLWVGDALVSVVVARPAPSPELSPVVGFLLDSTFPSGHVTGAVAFYGLLSFLTLRNVRRGHLRVLVPTLSVLMIGLASVGRIYAAAHWPSDVLGSYLFGFIGVVAIAALYTLVNEDRFHLPRFRKRQPEPVASGVKIARSIASVVYLDAAAGTAAKEYRPPSVVRALHRLAFQAPFPYQHSKAALEAAAAKRDIAGLLTRHRFGYDMVAQFLEIRTVGGRYQFVTEFVPGDSPKSNDEIMDTLSDLYTFFQETGLPTWQITPGNPHAYSNFIRTPQGALRLIDLESALVSFGPPWKQLRAFARDGHYPVFDDVDFVQLRGYVHAHAAELKENLGLKEFDGLELAVERAEVLTHEWKDREPRIWGRIASRIYRLLDMGRLITPIRRQMVNPEAAARAFAVGGIERWEREGRIDRAQAASLETTLFTSEAQTLLKHVGAHIVLSAAIPIPIPGLRSAARFSWTLAFRLKARSAFSKGTITRAEYQRARSLHSVPVMLIALVPAVGAIAYVASNTAATRGLGRLLLDQAAYRMPFGLYRRLRLARITAPPIPLAKARQSDRAVSPPGMRMSRTATLHRSGPAVAEAVHREVEQVAA